MNVQKAVMFKALQAIQDAMRICFALINFLDRSRKVLLGRASQPLEINFAFCFELMAT